MNLVKSMEGLKTLFYLTFLILFENYFTCKNRINCLIYMDFMTPLPEENYEI